MHIKPQCISCIFNQAYKVTNELGLDAKSSKDILDRASKLIPKFSLSLSPPQNALAMYEMIGKVLKMDDIYHEAKQKSIVKARGLLKKSTNLIENSEDIFLASTKIAVAGNVIDLASEVEFDLEDEIDKVVDAKFSIDDSLDLKESLKYAKKVVYLADNAGENEFDKLYIKYLKKLFPSLEVYYFVRSRPIINDICYKDLIDDDINDIAILIDSGVKTPGIVIDDLSPNAREIFDSCDVVISKGMGNYECLSEESVDKLFFLLKVKCEVVANSLDLRVGDIVCKKL